MHRGVGVLFTNNNRTLFLLQQKDENYHLHPYGISYFGGKMEDGESCRDTAFREVREELGAEAEALCKKAGLGKICTTVLQGPKGNFELNVFECVLYDSDFKSLSRVKPKEGRGSIVADRHLLRNVKMIFGIEKCLDYYAAEILHGEGE